MRNGVKKILKSRLTGTQVRLDSFFKVTSVSSPKRKADDKKENDKKKAKNNSSNLKKYR